MPGGISGLYPSLATQRREEAKAKLKKIKALYKEAKKIDRKFRKGDKNA